MRLYKVLNARNLLITLIIGAFVCLSFKKNGQNILPNEHIRFQNKKSDSYSVATGDVDYGKPKTFTIIKSGVNFIDIGIIDIVNPTDVISTVGKDSTFNIQVVVKNLGNETVTSLTINTNINKEDNLVTAITQLSLVPDETQVFSIFNMPIPATDFQLQMSIVSVNGKPNDDNLSNNMFVTHHRFVHN